MFCAVAAILVCGLIAKNFVEGRRYPLLELSQMHSFSDLLPYNNQRVRVSGVVRREFEASWISADANFPRPDDKHPYLWVDYRESIFHWRKVLQTFGVKRAILVGKLEIAQQHKFGHLGSAEARLVDAK